MVLRAAGHDPVAARDHRGRHRLRVLHHLRLGTPAVTTRGYLEPDCVALANWICDVLDNPADDNVIAGVRANVTKQCAQFPVYG